jgi:hypothetical protein
VFDLLFFEAEVEIEVNLRPTVSRPVCLVVGLPFGDYDQIFVSYLTIAFFAEEDIWTEEVLGDERMEKIA